MPSNPSPPRPLYQPGPDFNQRTIPVTRQPPRTWFRVHRSTSPAAQFEIRPHHRFSHPQCTFPFLYVGSSLSVCLWEYFGDDIFQGQRVISAAKWNRCSLSQIAIPQVKACAVSLESTRDAMEVDKASLFATNLDIPQAWGLAIQQHPATFDAIKYSSRFIDQPCLALFDRGGLAARIHKTLLGSLSNVAPAVDWLDERKAALV
jgi:RES domain